MTEDVTAEFERAKNILISDIFELEDEIDFHRRQLSVLEDRLRIAENDLLNLEDTHGIW
jgi:hypothetical protein